MKHSSAGHLGAVYGCFCVTIVRLSSWDRDYTIPSPGKSSEAAPGNSGQLKEEALPEELSRLGDLGKPVFHTVPLKRPRAACSASSLELHRNPPRTALLHAKSLQSCSTLCNLMDGSLPGFSVRGILQARISEWVSISFSRGLFPTQESNLSLLYLLHWQVGSLPLVPPGMSNLF